MSPNENIFENSESGYVPRFERDLKNAGGDISALAEKKKKESASPDSIDMEIDTSSLKNAEDTPEEAASENEAELDFIYGEDENYDYTKSLDEISAESIVLDDMDVKSVKIEEMRTDRSAIISSLKNQMQEDDLAFSVTDRPKLDDMSEEYGPSKKKKEDIAAKETLDRDEKELIKNRLKEEMESKPENYNKKESLAMYKKLMAEQKEKAARQGFIQLLITAALGLAAAVLIYITEPNSDAVNPIMAYLPMGALVFSLLMMLKSKFFKIMSTLYFTACSVLLVYPGIICYALEPENVVADDFFPKLGAYAAAFMLSAAVFIRLLTNKNIEAYYSYKPSKNKGRK